MTASGWPASFDDYKRWLAQQVDIIEQATAAALDALITTLAHRHPDAVAHARRVARMATALGRALRLDEATITDIERGALLHDIGKVAMPDALMQKPGPLTEEDIALIRTHVEVGREIVGAAPALAVAADIVGTSHEAWDGSGYPHGLTGEAIPIGARIIAIVDTFDALTWGRGDDDPVVYARAAAELVRCAGSQFDPDVVRAWLRVAEAGSPWSAAQRANGAARVQAVP